MPTAVVLSFSDLARDPRVSRQIGWLADGYAVTAAGLGPPARTGVRFIRVAPAFGGRSAKLLRGARLLARRHERVYWQAYGSAYPPLAGERPDLIVANDLDTLPLAVRLGEAAGAPVVFDAHEYAPREFDESWRWRLLRAPYAVALCRRYMPRAAAVVTVGPAIADEFARLTGMRPAVVTNAPAFHPALTPTPVSAERIRLVHHGAAVPARRLEQMVRLGPLLDPRFELTFMLVESDPAYLARLRESAAGHPRTAFRPPVPMPELPARLNDFDLGVYLLEPNSFNNRYALPNKFFEFLQGRLGVAIGPSPEMARVVRETGAGIVAPDFRPETLAAALNRLTADDVRRFKQAAHAAARAYSAEANREAFLAICREVLKRG
jgi:glycosyltransferase involved in cell wall biosynthesis